MQIVDAIRRQTTTSVQMIETQDQTVCILEDSIKQGDFIISFGAGDVWKVTERLARILEAGNFLH
jgi:UDP-N-acetylmuramate-alanine ligase